MRSVPSVPLPIVHFCWHFRNSSANLFFCSLNIIFKCSSPLRFLLEKLVQKFNLYKGSLSPSHYSSPFSWFLLIISEVVVRNNYSYYQIESQWFKLFKPLTKSSSHNLTTTQILILNWHPFKFLFSPFTPRTLKGEFSIIINCAIHLFAHPSNSFVHNWIILILPQSLTKFCGNINTVP